MSFRHKPDYLELTLRGPEALAQAIRAKTIFHLVGVAARRLVVNQMRGLLLERGITLNHAMTIGW